jgi:hypothetical protein
LEILVLSLVFFEWNFEDDDEDEDENETNIGPLFQKDGFHRAKNSHFEMTSVLFSSALG